MKEFYDQFFCELNNDYSVIIEDDGKVAYAYLLYHEEIIGNVWLYNQKKTPDNVDWSNEDLMPFLNPREFVRTELKPLTKRHKIELVWKVDNEPGFVSVCIYINDKMIAKMTDGSKPGWSTIVLKDGPLAKIIRDKNTVNTVH